MALKTANITLGTAGHIDHGKTSLVKFLTGCDTDRLKEEKERGMSIELGFAPCTISDLEVGIVDVPGHENFIKTMVAGASGMDGVILVVAADDGIMPQTREHLDILTLLGIQHGIVALTKMDRVPPGRLEEVRAGLAEFLRGTFLEGAPILPISNVTGEGFEPFYDTLADLVRSITPKRTDGIFRLPVERAFSVQGYGTVVSGVPVSGSARIGDELVLLPQGVEGRLKGIEVYGRTADTVMAGQCAALNVRQWDHSAIKHGDAVTIPGYFSPQEMYLCRLRLLAHERLSLKNGAQIKFHTGTSVVPATLYLMQGDRVQSGEEGIVQVRLSQPVVAGPGDRFIVRSLSPVQTIGGGMIVEGIARRLKRNRPEIQKEVEERAKAVLDEKVFVVYCIRSAPSFAASEAEISVRAKIPRNRLPEILNTLLQEGKIIALAPGHYIHCEKAADAEQRLLNAVAEFHRASPESPGLPIEKLQENAALPKAVCDSLMARLVQEGKLVEKNRRVALAEHRESIQEEDLKLLEKIESLFIRRPFNPPSPEEIIADAKFPKEKVDKALRILVEHERLVRLPEDLLFHKQAVDRAREILVEFMRKEGKLESVKFKYLLDTTRKFAIPLLDYMDRIGVTQRVGNTRYLKPAR
jgi:selenocysteine-specific elongation factor